jgi:hypothetical protein
MWEWRYSSAILRLDTRWRCVVGFTPWSLYSRGESPNTHWLGGWVEPRAGLAFKGKGEKSLVLTWNQTPHVYSVVLNADYYFNIHIIERRTIL